jgi:hypothetical protein
VIRFEGIEGKCDGLWMVVSRYWSAVSTVITNN